MKEKGITIVALVITITILLIISGLTIEVLIGKDGIISKTAETKQATEISSEKEKIQLSVIQAAQDNKSLKVEVDKLNQNLINAFGKDETALREDGNKYLVKIVKTQRYYSVEANGEVTLLGNASDIEKNMQNIEIGENLLDLAKLKSNTYISSENGGEVEYNGWSASDYMYVGNCKKVLVVSDCSSFLSSYNALYSEDKQTLRTVWIKNNKVTNDVLGQVNVSISVLNLKKNERYLRVSERSSVINHIRIYPILNEDFNNVIEFDINSGLIDEYNLGENIFENGNIIKNTYINATNGDEVKYTSWDSTDFIDVGGYTKVAIAYEGATPVNSYSAMYDSKKKYVSKISVVASTIDLEKGNIEILKIPENVKYIRLSTDSGHLDNIKVYPIVNKEVTNYTNQNIKIENSILNSENIIDDYYIEKDGKDVSYKGWSETDYFDLSKYKSLLVIGNDNIYNAIYDKDKQFIKTVNFSMSVKIYFSVVSGQGPT